MKTVRQILPAISITGIMIVMLLLLYRGIYGYAEEKCWQDLEDTAQQVAGRIAAEFEDDVAKLHIMKAILENTNPDAEDYLEVLYLDEVLPSTMFARIDIWYPDNTVVSSGIRQRESLGYSFEEIAARGEYMSGRKIDPHTGNETVYYLLPIMEHAQTPAILIGVIDLKAIAGQFHPKIYEGEGEICVIDSEDGSFIIDSWHEELGNAYDMPTRKRARGYETVDLAQKIKDLEIGVIVFESKTTGEPLYMYFTALGLYDWQFAVFAEENTIFEYLFQLRRYVVVVGVIMTVMIVLYFVWSINTVWLLRKKVVELEEKKELLRTISYTDALTSIYNRTKYTEVWKSLKERSLKNVGVAYFDLNGLKQINDASSHDAGDEYIRRTALVLAEGFPEDCYRIGGDEFVILSVGLENAVFTDRILQIKECMKENGISISAGFCWRAECSNIRELRKEAEAQMYQEKERYYQTHDRCQTAEQPLRG